MTRFDVEFKEDMTNLDPMAQVLDWRYLMDLSGGDLEFEGQLLEIFIADTENHLNRLGQAIDANDLDLIIQEAHQIKGASANVGAIALRAAAETLEKQARQRQVSDAQTQYAVLKQHLAVVKQLTRQNAATQRRTRPLAPDR